VSNRFTESVVEDVALTWLENLGYAVKYGPEIAPGEFLSERMDYGQGCCLDRGRQLVQEMQQFRWIIGQGTVSVRELVGR
jgi:type I restriction enzyme R subunit